MKFTFKSVGNGDSILLEWQEEELKKIAIVDCKLHNSSNPVLDHLIESEYQEIEFCVLSHPHYDHYSGLLQLFEYCLSKNIKINRFLHTCFQTKEYIKTAVESYNAKRQLIRTFKSVRDLRNAGLASIHVIDDNPHIIQLGQCQMEFLAPSSFEYDAFVKADKSVLEDLAPSNIDAANHLSTVIKISSGDNYVLLTSDSEVSTLKRIGIKNANRLNGKLHSAQCPHHGADKNHYRAFWNNRELIGDPVVAISTGCNLNYGHPSQDVITYFRKLGCAVYATCNIAPLGGSNPAETVETALDVFSDVQSTGNVNSDVVIVL